ncbi:MAG: hypothetical protein ACOYIR_01135 [Christensenellales bacterium]|jgi:hypothetical protein
MNRLKTFNARRLSVAAFSFSFAYLLSFLFEGQVLYGLLEMHGANVSAYILTAMIAHFMGLLTCGLFVRSRAAAKSIMLSGMSISLAATVPFFFSPSSLWLGGLMISAYFSGCAVAAWGFFLRAFTPKNERMKSCADVLIYSNLLMIAVNVVAMNCSPFIGLSLSMLCLVIGMAFIWMLPVGEENEQIKAWKEKTRGGIKNQLILLCLFVFIITINSGLMYQVINPAFEHLTGLVSWYWAVPYIVALVIMRNLPMKAKRSRILYIGMAMIMGAFISFMLLGRKTSDYHLIVDTLMLGACGIFDLFWWSILGEMLDYSDNPAQTFGIGLSANVFGVLCGGVLGMVVTSMRLASAEIAVIALTVVLENKEEGYKIEAYDFKLGEMTEFSDFITLRIPYDTSYCEEGQDPAKCVGAKYKNETTGEWEDVLFEVDAAADELIIYTDHLSTFGAFYVRNEGRRNAYITDVYSGITGIDQQQAMKTLREYVAGGGADGEEAANLAARILTGYNGFLGGVAGAAGEVGFATDLTGTILNIASLGSPTFDTALASSAYKKMNKLGKVAAVVKIGAVMFSTKKTDDTLGLYKDTAMLALSYAESAAWGLAASGLFLFDYAITTLFEQGLAMKMDKIGEVYVYFNDQYISRDRNLKWKARAA